MPRYPMHLRNGTDELLDLDGMDLTLEAVPTAALRAARDRIAHDVMNGRIECKYRIDVEDEHGTIVHSLAFADAVEFVPAP